jgi:hypothetical protein
MGFYAMSLFSEAGSKLSVPWIKPGYYCIGTLGNEFSKENNREKNGLQIEAITHLIM